MLNVFSNLYTNQTVRWWCNNQSVYNIVRIKGKIEGKIKKIYILTIEIVKMVQIHHRCIILLADKWRHEVAVQQLTYIQ